MWMRLYSYFVNIKIFEFSFTAFNISIKNISNKINCQSHTENAQYSFDDDKKPSNDVLYYRSDYVRFISE